MNLVVLLTSTILLQSCGGGGVLLVELDLQEEKINLPVSMRLQNQVPRNGLVIIGGILMGELCLGNHLQTLVKIPLPKTAPPIWRHLFSLKIIKTRIHSIWLCKKVMVPVLMKN